MPVRLTSTRNSDIVNPALVVYVSAYYSDIVNPAQFVQCCTSRCTDRAEHADSGKMSLGHKLRHGTDAKFDRK